MKQIREMDGTYHRRIVTEEHLSIMQEPGSNYLTHMKPKYSGTSISIVASVLETLTECGVDMNCIKVVGCDCTVLNTGGIIRGLEELVNRPLQ